MSTHTQPEQKFCILGKHSKASYKDTLNKAKAKLLQLQTDLSQSMSAGKETKDIQTEIDNLKEDVVFFTEQVNYKWITLSRPMLLALEFKEKSIVTAINHAIKRSESQKKPVETKALKSLLTDIQANIKAYRSNLKSSLGAQHICEGCAQQMADALDISSKPKNLPAVIEEKKEGTLVKSDIPTPKQIREFLNEYVIGQGHAKVLIASEVNEHYIKIAAMLNGTGPQDGSVYKKSNILLIGPTGCGKTEIMRTLSKCLSHFMGKIPMVSESATKYTEAGYVGKDVEETISALYRKAESHIIKKLEKSGQKLKATEIRQRAVDIAEMGIVYIDEIDKISNDGSGVGGSVSRGGVQDALLSLIEGEIITIKLPGSQPGTVIHVDIDTSRMLFVASGAFSGDIHGKKPSVYEIANKARGGQAESETTGPGFDAETPDTGSKGDNDDYMRIDASDVITYGLKSEVIGRFDLFATLTQLRKKDLRRIMTEPKGAIVTQLTELNRKERNIELEFEDKALNALAQLALDRGTGARALSGTVKRLLESVFAAPEHYEGKKVVITEASVTNELKMKVLDPKTGKKAGRIIPIKELVQND